MGKFGKKNEINLNPLAYNIGLLGESGVGKSTIIKHISHLILERKMVIRQSLES